MNRAQNRGDSVLAAWQEQLADAARQPLLARAMMERSREILPRFACFYEALRGLPRPRRRALQRKLRLTLSAVALMLALGSEPAPAATIDVDGTICTLVDAITAANTDTASGGCLAGNGADTLALSPGSTHTLNNVSAGFYGPTGLPVIASEILIEGNGATIERDSSAPEFRILVVNPSGKLTLEQATVTGGIAVDGEGPNSYSRGGGLYSYGGDVTLSGSTISGNSAWRGGGIYVDARGSSKALTTIADSVISGNSGGGVFSSSPAEYTYGVLTIANCTISGNSGGGIAVSGYNDSSSTTTISDSTISGNSGAGVSSFSESGELGSPFLTLTIVNSTIAGNSGGGVLAIADSGSNQSVSIASSTISGNAAQQGGGVSIYGESSDIYLTITNSTISDNSAAGIGGGVFANGDIDLRITDSTITGNSAGEEGGGVHVSSYFYDAYSDETVPTFNRSIFSGNVALSGPEVVIDPSAPATITADNFNLFGFDGDAGVVGFLPGPSDIVPASGVLLGDILDPILADNGGPTSTHALAAGSPAIDAIASTVQGCEGADQRGVPRPQDGNANGLSGCDVGAYELAAEAVPFARFDIAKARVKLRRRAGRDQFNVSGSFGLAAQSDGVEVLNEEVVVTFGGFTETIPPGSFRRVRRGDREEGRRIRHFLYKGSPGGIQRLKLTVGGVGGRFSIIAKRLDLEGLTLPATVPVALRIGDDVAQTMIRLNRKGSFTGREGEGEAETD